MGLKWLPNAVTIGRCLMAVFVALSYLWMMDEAERNRASGAWLFIPFILFSATAATDWLDGYLARALDAESAFGARLDPIADKLLVGACLIAMAHAEHWDWFLMIPTVVIVGRDVLLTAMREALGNPAGMKVSSAAKWKTAVALVAIGMFLFAVAISHLAGDADRMSLLWIMSRGPLLIGLLGIWVAAIMSIITAIDYVKASG